MRFLSLLLCPLLALNPVWAQKNSAAPPEASADPSALHVHVVDDPGIVLTQSTSPKGYVMQVTNAAGAPVSGAAVALRLPEAGPTGRFANGLRAWVAYSDPAGIARFPVIQWGEQAGPVALNVTAAKGSNHTALVIGQQIGPEHPSVSVVSVPLEKPPVAAAPVAPIPAPPAKTGTVVVKQNNPAVVPPSSHPVVIAASAAPVATVISPFEESASKPADPPAPHVSVPAQQPGVVSPQQADVVPQSPMNISRSGTSAPHKLTPDPPASKESDTAEPTVSITNSPTGAGHESHKKVWVLIAVGAGAGAGAMLALKAAHGSGSSSAASSSGISVGTPTISLGH